MTLDNGEPDNPAENRRSVKLGRRFRKRPVEIDAVWVWDALHCAEHAWDKLPGWIVEAYNRGEIVFQPKTVTIKTLEGWMTGQHDDWIVRGVEGELYPVKRTIFEQTYEAVDDAR